MTKEEIIELIIQSEKLAEETISMSLRQDLYEIKKKSLNQEHAKELLAVLFSDLINKYDSTFNLYKSSSEQFFFIKDNTDNDLEDYDRFDFISMIFETYLDFNTDIDDDARRDAINQLENLEEIVYETKLLELKVNKIKALLKSDSTYSKDDVKKLSINQIALKYVYENNAVTRENCNNIIKKYGHNSGEKLFQRYTYYSSVANRKGLPNPLTSKKLKNKIELLKSVIQLIDKNAQNRVKDEIKILEAHYKNEFE